MAQLHVRLEPSIVAQLAAVAARKKISKEQLAAGLIEVSISAGADTAGVSRLHERLSDHAAALARHDQALGEISERTIALLNAAESAAARIEKLNDEFDNTLVILQKDIRATYHKVRAVEAALMAAGFAVPEVKRTSPPVDTTQAAGAAK